MKALKWSIAIVSLLLAPVLGYVLVNFYWWLFDGNVIRVEKMGTAIFVTLIFGGTLGVLVGVLHDEIVAEREEEAKRLKYNNNDKRRDYERT